MENIPHHKQKANWKDNQDICIQWWDWFLSLLSNYTSNMKNENATKTDIEVLNFELKSGTSFAHPYMSVIVIWYQIKIICPHTMADLMVQNKYK